MRMTPWIGWGAVLGFGLGGFFDGILLHQILQWHHLLSQVSGLEDLRLQVLWDGYFHALMYVIAAAGLWGLWRAQRRGLAGAGPGLLGALLAGFGLWHGVDAVLSHWLLGIHRIRQDSPTPLFWDLVWLAGFGLLPLLLGLWLGRGGGSSRPPLAGTPAVLLFLALGTAGAGAWALRPPPGPAFTTIVFRPGLGVGEVLGALAAQDARLVWSDAAMGVVVVAVPPSRRWGFYAEGALLVSGAGLPPGYLGWSRV